MTIAQQQLEFEFSCPQLETEYYREGAQDLIHKLVPRELLDSSSTDLSFQRAKFADLLPQIAWSDLNKAPCPLSVLLLCKYRLNACNFFYDMVSRWLLPNRRTNVELFFASDVRLPHLSEELLSVAEVVIYLKSVAEVEEVKKNLAALETEIKLGVASNYHARRILEFKGLSSDGKTAMIQEKIGSLIQSHSKEFDQGIFSQMQQFLINCSEEFKGSRDYHHISRIISNLHSTRKVLKQNIEMFPLKRHGIVKLLKTRLQTPSSQEGGVKERNVLGILAGLNFLREHEVFEAEHLMAAIQQQVAKVRLVPGSCLVDPAREQPLQTIYLEIEKEDGTDFSLLEIQQLKNRLPEGLKGHIEQLTHPIFMPRNEEEVLRNIMALAKQLRFANDLPQVYLSFEEAREEELYFTVILVRPVTPNAPSIQDCLSRGEFKYIPDRVRNVGSIRRKYIKEATVFRTSVPMSQFLRPDRSIDLYKARHNLFFQLQASLGELRDYNGGMIERQGEQLNALKGMLGKTAQAHPLLLERFFHALMPMEVRTSSELEPLKQLFLLLVSATRTESRLPFLGSDFLFKQEENRLFAILPRLDGEKRREFFKKLESLHIPNHCYIHASLDIDEIPYVGVVLLQADQALQAQFLRDL